MKQHAGVPVPVVGPGEVGVGNAVRRNPDLRVIVRGRSSAEIGLLRRLGAGDVIVPELEGGLEIMRQTLLELGYDADETLAFGRAVRDIHYGEDLARR